MICGLVSLDHDTRYNKSSALITYVESHDFPIVLSHASGLNHTKRQASIPRETLPRHLNQNTYIYFILILSRGQNDSCLYLLNTLQLITNGQNDSYLLLTYLLLLITDSIIDTLIMFIFDINAILLLSTIDLMILILVYLIVLCLSMITDKLI